MLVGDDLGSLSLVEAVVITSCVLHSAALSILSSWHQHGVLLLVFLGLLLSYHYGSHILIVSHPSSW